MLTATFIFLALALAFQTVRSWWYRKIWNSSVKVTAKLVEELDDAIKQNHELKVQLSGSRAANKYLGKISDEWPDSNQEFDWK